MVGRDVIDGMKNRHMAECLYDLAAGKLKWYQPRKYLVAAAYQRSRQIKREINAMNNMNFMGEDEQPDEGKDKMRIPNSENMAWLDFEAQLREADEKVKILQQGGTIRAVKKPRAPAATKTTLVGYLKRRLPSINAKPPVNNSFAPFSGYTLKELEKIVRKIRRNPVHTPKPRKEVKSKPPLASPPPPPIRYYSADAIEMERLPGSGINGIPIYKPKMGG